nr:preprotein translocase subunit YajC [Corynebacterium lactis]
MDPILLLVLLVIFLALPLWQIVKQNKQVRNIREMQSKLVPGAEVITGSGLHGIVVDASETTVDLTIADGVVTRWEKAAIARNLSEGTGADYARRDLRGQEPVADPAEAESPAAVEADAQRDTPTEERS